MTNDQLIADLRETRRQLETRGRCVAFLVSDTGKVCLDGAIIAAVMGEVHDAPTAWSLLTGNPRIGAVTGALADQIPDDHQAFCRTPKSWLSASSAVFFFNDDSGTTDEDCFSLIDKTLAELGGL